MKKLIKWIVIAAVLITCVIACVFVVNTYLKNKESEEDNETSTQASEGLLYTLSSDGTYYICDGIGDCESSIITVANTYNGLPVKEIGDKAFYFNDSIQSVTILSNVKIIGNYAFWYCKNLKTVTIGNGVTEIGYEAFYDCINLKNINLPDSLNTICDEAFDNCKSLTGSLVIPDSVKEVGAYAFSGTNFESISISKNLTIINEKAFGSSLLKEVDIPDSVTSIEEGAFQGCWSLETIIIPESVNYIGREAFFDCNLKSVIFKDTNGWSIKSYITEEEGIDISSSDLSDTSTAATYLTDTYYYRYWYKK